MRNKTALSVFACAILAFVAIFATVATRPDSEGITASLTIEAIPTSVAIYFEDGMADNTYSTNITPSADGSISSVETNVRIVTNGVYGYELYLHTTNSNGNMIGQDTGTTLSPMGGTIPNPIPFTASNCNSWGFATPAEDGNFSSAFDSSYTVMNNMPTTIVSSNFASVPTTLTAIHENVSSDLTDKDETRSYYFAFCAGANITADEYKANIVWTAIAIDEPPVIIPPIAENAEFIQNVSNDRCPTNRTWVVDARDNRTYWIRKIPNSGAGGTDLCWMETNLAYAGGGNNQFGDVKNLNERNAGAGRWDVAPANGIPFVRTDVASPVPPSSCTGSAPFSATNCTLPTTGSGNATGANGAQYGYHYNWCGAMGGQTPACNTTATTGFDTSVSICPAGRRLPVSNALNSALVNDFSALNNAVNGGSATSDAGLRSQWLGVYAGNVSDPSSWLAVNVSGNYWSSTISHPANSRIITFGVSQVVVLGLNTKSYGYPVRCVR